MEEGPKVRTNGFERPFHPLQVLSWAVFGSDVTAYAIFALPLVETLAAKVLVALCYVSSVVVLVLATAKATVCDPADPHVGMREADTKAEELQTMPYCTMCNVPVHTRSKHCRACNKCVTVFDHHCMWLNNCIGLANYRSFFVTISSVAVMIGIVLGTCLYLVIDGFVNEDEFVKRMRGTAVHRGLPRELILGLLIAMLAVNVPLFILDMQLVLLHTFLASQDMTTYEYIMNKRSLDTATAKAALGRRIRTLPHCMDWIVFSRCGQRRRRKGRGDLERAEGQGAPAPGEADGAARGSGRSADAAASSEAQEYPSEPHAPRAGAPSRDAYCEAPLPADCEEAAPYVGKSRSGFSDPRDPHTRTAIDLKGVEGGEPAQRRPAEPQSAAVPPAKPRTSKL